MNKFKELWGKNKVLIVLGIILIICVIAILTVGVSFFFGGTDARADKTKGHEVSENFKSDYITYLEENKEVEKVTINALEGVIHIHVKFVNDTALEDAQNKIATSLSLFEEENLSEFWDLNFTITCEKSEKNDGFNLIGSKNVAGSGLSWDNNSPVEESEE